MERIEINKDNSRIVYDVIPKQKIRDKIKEYKQQCFITTNNYDTCENCDNKCAKGYKIMALEDLLKEN